MTYKNHGPIEFAGIIKNAGGGGAYVEFPFSVEELFGVKGRVPVKIVFENTVEYTGSLAKMGPGNHMTPVLKSIREQLQKEFGDSIHIQVTLDTSERKIELAEDVKIALAKIPGLLETFTKLAFTHQREHMQYIEEAKKPETRERRIQNTIERLQKTDG